MSCEEWQVKPTPKTVAPTATRRRRNPPPLRVLLFMLIRPLALYVAIHDVIGRFMIILARISILSCFGSKSLCRQGGVAWLQLARSFDTPSHHCFSFSLLERVGLKSGTRKSKVAKNGLHITFLPPHSNDCSIPTWDRRLWKAMPCLRRAGFPCVPPLSFRRMIPFCPN